MKKALFFSPFSNIWVHALPEVSLMKSLIKDNYEVGYIKCDKLLTGFCICMSAIQMNFDAREPETNEGCIECKRNGWFIPGQPYSIPYSAPN